MKSKTTEARKMYACGQDVASIAQILGVTRVTVYNWKKKDSVDWDDLAINQASDSTDIEAREKQFIVTLIQQFESSLEELQAQPAQDQVKALAQYVQIYYKLKAQKENPRVTKAEIAKKTIHKISTLALEQQNNQTIEFLSTNADLIVQAVNNEQ